MARKGNSISVRLDLNRSSDSSWFSEGDHESHRLGVGGCCKCRGRTRLLLRLRLEDYWKTPRTRACRERSPQSGHASTVSGAQLNVDIMNARCRIPGGETRATTPLYANR
ncbi:hypothetical protein M9H77_13306 [Catharanthus roseus]|uniref:Uncharacterized protein n=1 Tax=Catharanthus roseus TaxID=4058 RepID=A0ACC0BK13_CATRO|nr:hypothetical protein M9H77_13306 [Catharanthus roseus]